MPTPREIHHPQPPEEKRLEALRHVTAASEGRARAEKFEAVAIRVAVHHGLSVAAVADATGRTEASVAHILETPPGPDGTGHQGT
jgi:hypothetical protein